MRYSQVALAAGLALFGSWLGAPARAETEDWTKVVEAAKREGEVIVWGQASESGRRFWKDAFEKANPGIIVRLFQANNLSERDTRAIREFQAGLLKLDIFIAGSAGMVARLKAEKVTRPLRPLLRAETLEGKNWLNGAPVWVDLGKEYVMIADLPAGTPAIVNESVPEGAIRAWNDLLDPKYDGKIISLDPRQSGQGYAFSLFLYANKDLGPAYVEKFFKGGRITFTPDQRQITEWVDSGRMQIGFAVREPEIVSILNVGGKVRALPALIAGDVPQTITVGSDSAISIPNLDPLPHPNAARVYANWIYSREGQQAMVDTTGLFSVRADVDTSKLSPRVRQVPGVKYTNANDEALNGTEMTRLMREAVSKAIAQK